MSFESMAGSRPGEWRREWHRVARRASQRLIGGHLLVAVPRLETLPAHRDYRYVLNGRAHIMAYTGRCLGALLVRSGWEIVASPLEHMNRLAARRADGDRRRAKAARKALALARESKDR